MDAETSVIYYQLRSRLAIGKRANDRVVQTQSLIRHSHTIKQCQYKSVLVDAAEWEWRGKKWCHLVSTQSLEQLHNFATLVGLQRDWFQDEPGFPHYDLTISKRQQALSLGAKPVSNFTLVAHTYAETWPSERLKSARIRMREKYPLNL